MIKYLFFTLFILLSVSSNAQIASQLDGHVGYSIPLGKNYPISAGPSIDLEPKFWYNDEITIGAKIGTNLLTSPAVGVKLAPLSSIMLLCEKYKGDGDIIMFYGAGVGMYFGGQTRKINGVPYDLKAAKQLGITPRAGVQMGSYRLMGEIHVRQQEAKFVSLMLGYTFGTE